MEGCSTLADITCEYGTLQQAGLVEVLVRKFRSAGALCAAYVAASVALHAAWLLDKWAAPDAVSTPLLICLFTLQRCCMYLSLGYGCSASSSQPLCEFL